jgi:hypothetical protein
MDPMEVEVWRQSRSGCVGISEMIPPWLGFKGQPCN